MRPSCRVIAAVKYMLLRFFLIGNILCTLPITRAAFTGNSCTAYSSWLEATCLNKSQETQFTREMGVIERTKWYRMYYALQLQNFPPSRCRISVQNRIDESFVPLHLT